MKVEGKKTDKAELIGKIAGQARKTKKYVAKVANAVTDAINRPYLQEKKLPWSASALLRSWKEKQGKELILRQEKLFRSQLKRFLSLDQGRV